MRRLLRRPPSGTLYIGRESRIGRPLGPRMAGRIRPHVALIALTVVLLGVRAASAILVSQPGYTDAYYYATVAGRIARGEGLTADFVWNFVEAPQFQALPIASHRFWMPMASLIQAAGIRTIGGLVGDFRAAQAAITFVAAFIPVVTYGLARRLGVSRGGALTAAGLAGLGGAFAPVWVGLDSFAPAAVLGGGFFLSFARAASGDVRAGAAAGVLVGLLHLARAEGALFGLALLWLVGFRRSARAGLAGSAVALVIGLLWLGRNAALGFPADLFSRSALLVRYQDFFALSSPTLEAFLSAPAEVASVKLFALITNAGTASLVFIIVLLAPLARGAVLLRARSDVRAFLGLAAITYLVESLVFTLHSVEGSYFHSLAAFLPFGMALAVAGGEDWLAGRTAQLRRTAAAAILVGVAIVSGFMVLVWAAEFDPPYRARRAVMDSLPPGPLVAIDSSAWRWTTGREVVVAPADGPHSAMCVAIVYLASTLILESAHVGEFPAYRQLYEGGTSEHFVLSSDHGDIKVFRLREDQRCIIGGPGPDFLQTVAGPGPPGFQIGPDISR